MQTLVQTFRLIRSDLGRRVAYDNRRPGFWSSLAVLLSPPGMAVAIWRFQKFLWGKRLRPITKLLAIVNMTLFTTEIEADATIGEGFVVLNPNGVMIHNHTRIGRNCTIAHQVTMTIGPRPGLDVINDYIDIGDDVILSAGVRIIGNLTIGDRVFVGPNTVVAASVPDDCNLEGKRQHGLLSPQSA
jgi:serine O-acetyltransferase